MSEIEIWLGIFFLAVVYVVINLIIDAKNPNLREHVQSVKFTEKNNKQKPFVAEVYNPKQDQDQILKGNIVDDFD